MPKYRMSCIQSPLDGPVASATLPTLDHYQYAAGRYLLLISCVHAAAPFLVPSNVDATPWPREVYLFNNSTKRDERIENFRGDVYFQF